MRLHRDADIQGYVGRKEVWGFRDSGQAIKWKRKPAPGVYGDAQGVVFGVSSLGGA